ncbi:mediator of RNA polymerase II transcription subunit 11 [Euwallacea fornicatus]|uniref:mediator of RNA polymerase II transcription subunit 11 n=1 Tax=Euwallacea fornicatus TaxID=995702 RepID=UPI00338F2C54
MAAPMERIQLLDSIEKDIITCLNSAGQVFLELSKEKSSLKQAENHTQTFLKTLGAVENKLTDQINYLTQVSTGQPHEGSGYASQKVLQMAWHRLEHAKSRVNELEKIKLRHSQGRSGQPRLMQSQPQMQPGMAGSALNPAQIQSQST